MKKIFLDIETIPADESSHVVLKDIYESRKSKGKKVADDFDAYLAQTNFDGSKVFDYFKAGKLEEIYEYCKADVDAVRAVYKKIVFEDLIK